MLLNVFVCASAAVNQTNSISFPAILQTYAIFIFAARMIGKIKIVLE